MDTRRLLDSGAVGLADGMGTGGVKENLRFLDAGLEAIERVASADKDVWSTSGRTLGHIQVMAACYRARLGESPRVRRDVKTGRFRSASTGKEKPHGPL